MLVSVLVEVKSLKEKTFVYSVPNDLSDKVNIGVRVCVPFGNRNVYGLVIGYVENSEYDTKDIISVLDDTPIFSAELIELGKTMSTMYICSLISSYESMLPSALKFNNNNIKIKY